MKKYIAILFAAFALLGCSKFDDTSLWNAIKENAAKIAKLEERVNALNSDVSTLKTLVDALQKGDMIKTVSELADGLGYTIVFTSGKSIVIKNGSNGQDGQDGKDGQDGQTPNISVKQDTDGIYYWTLNGSWLLDDSGNKIQAQGTNGSNGQNGENGQDGITPKFKIEEGYWYISYDNEKTWAKLGKASGDNGLNGENGDSFFKGVSIEDGYVKFVLNDGNDTVIRIQFAKETSKTIAVENAGTIGSLLSKDERRTLISLKVCGVINEDDLRFLNVNMRVLEDLDLSECDYLIEKDYDFMFRLNPYATSLFNTTFITVAFPRSVKGPKDSAEGYGYIPSYCLNLEKIIFPPSSGNWNPVPNTSFDTWNYTASFHTIEYMEGNTYFGGNVNSCPAKLYVLPSSIKYVSDGLSGGNVGTDEGYSIICKATVPPVPWDYSSKQEKNTFRGYYLDKITLYVPSGSVEAYKNSAWGACGSILPIEK